MEPQNNLEHKERTKYERMWSEVPSYRITSPGYLCANIFFDHFKNRIKPSDSITDFGCGPGLTNLVFLDYQLRIELCDIAENCLEDKIEALTLLMPDKVRFTRSCLWSLPDSIKPTDWIYCTDVLEHIPPEKIDTCLKEMAKRTLKGGSLQIVTKDDNFGEAIGDTLHLTIKPKEWWLEKSPNIGKSKRSSPSIKTCAFPASSAPKKINRPPKPAHPPALTEIFFNHPRATALLENMRT